MTLNSEFDTAAALKFQGKILGLMKFLKKDGQNCTKSDKTIGCGLAILCK